MADFEIDEIALWNDIFGLQEFAQDCFGTWIHRDDYENYEILRIGPQNKKNRLNYGWTINRIKPEVKYHNPDEADFPNNYEPMHHLNSEQKGNDYPNFTINEEEFQVIHCQICIAHNRPGYGILNIKTKQRVDWKGRQNNCFS